MKFLVVVLVVALGSLAAVHYFPRETARATHTVADKAQRASRELKN